ncbi:hypothetical protein QWY82_06640 [Simiduia curdlanivorans]|uniref:Serine aminopeptidase S33 domain-containing protein n=1 Tax=Simiduia curdlanivorans TaxID=1492769 RepID=A0ABV8V9S1_9GAMM|nr:hypothetical protein [Simiduia curdlanivorans]MDN3638481.1 hypothetical protein [Simiduia curdlanivorans]
MNAQSVREQVCLIGRPSPLVGVLTAPANPVRPNCMMLILNSGVIHRVGACRLSVEVARGFSEKAGMSSFRFDYSGLGDSPVRRTELGRDELAQSEIGEVMDYLQASQGVSQFILFGLCSGARDAVHVAAGDERVVGVVQLDGYAYRNWRYYFTHYRARVFNFGAWKGLLAKVFAKLWSRVGRLIMPVSDESASARKVELGAEVNWGEYPPCSEIAAVYRSLAQRSVRLFVQFTGSWDDQYNYSGQFFDMFSEVNFGDTVNERLCPQLDHIHSDPRSRRELTEALAAWASSYVEDQGRN